MSAKVHIAATQAQQRAAIDLLADAFEHDPMMQRFVNAAPSYDPSVLRRKIVAALVSSHRKSGQSLYVLQDDKGVKGAALVESHLAMWRRLLGLVLSLPKWLQLPRSVFREMNDYAKISQSGLAKKADHFIVMIAIAKSARGQGLGGQFLRDLELVCGQGLWCLDTENPQNVALYEHMGYELYDAEAIGSEQIFKFRKQVT